MNLPWSSSRSARTMTVRLSLAGNRLSIPTSSGGLLRISGGV